MKMTADQFEQLLYVDEGATVDFKEDQYPFSSADSTQKSELLKDILGFANAWRQSDSYILIGVREVRGTRSEVIGIQEHLPEHSLQQFVNSKTNRPLRFSYNAFEFKGKQVGIILIELQERPFWLNKDYGKLKKDKVYIRRGSSTDPTKPAPLEEIEKMIKASAGQAASLEVQFADGQSGNLLGSSIQMQNQFLEFPPADTIPTLQPRRPQSTSFHVAVPTNPFQSPNSEYYRELALYHHHHINFCPVRLAIKNTGQVSAEDVRLELRLPLAGGLEVIDEYQIEKDAPQRERGLYATPVTSIMNLPLANTPDGAVTITNDASSAILEVEYSKIQPGRHVSIQKFFIACPETRTILIEGCVFSKHLPQPLKVALTIKLEIEHGAVDIDRFLEWADDSEKTQEE